MWFLSDGTIIIKHTEKFKHANPIAIEWSPITIRSSERNSTLFFILCYSYANLKPLYKLSYIIYLNLYLNIDIY